MSLLQWGLLFLVVALVSGLFGFTKLSGMAGNIAKAIFVIFLILAVLSFIGLNINF